MICKAVRVTGRVQGVFYRASTKTKAQTLGLKGWVKNEQDGSVKMQIEGDEDKINQMIDWCHQGPSQASVDKVEVVDEELRGYETFEVRYF
ncbi:MAG: acylphosphatase [Cyclobacteriaceae bacterium]